MSATTPTTSAPSRRRDTVRPRAADPAAQPVPSTVGTAEHERRLDELAQIIQAYNDATQNLQRSHESLEAEVARLRKELASADAQLQRSRRLAALGEMAAGIAHEVRNPLAAIQLYAAMIVEDLEAAGARPDVAAANARKIGDAVRGLNAIVNDVLTFAREIQPRPQAACAHALLRRAWDASRPILDATHVEVVLDDADEPTTLVNADAALIHQALLNLIRNAADAMAQNRADRPRRLELAVRRADSEAALIIRDTGPGIAHAQVDRIFNPFFTTRDTGTGLGLAIVHRIVDAHGGAITVHNDPQTGGAVFTLTLPIADESARATAVAEPVIDRGATRVHRGRACHASEAA